MPSTCSRVIDGNPRQVSIGRKDQDPREHGEPVMTLFKTGSDHSFIARGVAETACDIKPTKPRIYPVSVGSVRTSGYCDAEVAVTERCIVPVRFKVADALICGAVIGTDAMDSGDLAFLFNEDGMTILDDKCPSREFSNPSLLSR